MRLDKIFTKASSRCIRIIAMMIGMTRVNPTEYYVEDYRTPNDDDPPSGSVNENDADLRLFEQTYDISSHVAHSNWNRLYCDYNSLDYY